MTAGAHFHPPGVMHDHPHGSTHDVGESYAHVQGGPTVLDIGGVIGALVATMNPQAVGGELHLRSEHEPPISIHTGVWQRHAGQGVVTAAVFAELPAGTYWVLDDAGRGRRRVQIQGGALQAIDLRG